MSATVGVVIRCLNEERHIGRLLAGLARQTRVPEQVVVVDSGSVDATVDIASHYTSDIVHVPPADFSFGRALNRGCDVVKTDVIVFVSAHVYPLYDSYLEMLTRPFDEPAVALAYGRQVGDHRTRYSESRLMLKWFPARSIPAQPYPFCNNANAAIRRSVWEDNAYDEELTGLEDLDWAKRAQARGHQVHYVAEAPVAHVHEETWSRIVTRYRREAVAYRRIMGARHVNGLRALGLAVGNTLVDYVHAAREGVLLPNLTSIPMFRTAQFYGTWSGFARDDEVTEGLKRRFYYPLPVREGGPRVESVPGELIDYSAEET